MLRVSQMMRACAELGADRLLRAFQVSLVRCDIVLIIARSFSNIPGVLLHKRRM